MPGKMRIMLLEDDPSLFDLISEELEGEGYKVFGCQRINEARASLAHHPIDLLITDLRLPDGNGMELVSELVNRSDESQIPGIIVITAFGSVRQAVEALQLGANDFLTKPLDIDHLLLSVKRVLQTQQIRQELNQYRSLSKSTDFYGMYGKSQPMRALFSTIKTLAEVNGPVLVEGESGTGKELVANALHALSRRSDQAFLAVNCAGIPDELLESEFFGHQSGAFTGAKGSRKGLFQEADGGTLFLDEIAEMPLKLQAKLLRALQDGWIRPVGQDTEIQVDVRIIAATHQNLKQCVEQGKFREDLYYRLETFAITVPPLRAREDDIEYLTMKFIALAAVNQQKGVKLISPGALDLLKRYPFPGNVRELQNVLDRAVVFCDSDTIQEVHLPDRVKQRHYDPQNSSQDAADSVDHLLLDGRVWPTMEQLQKRYAKLVLAEVQGNKQRAAAILGIGRRTLYRWLDE